MSSPVDHKETGQGLEHPAPQALCLIPPSVYERVEQGLGKFFEPISGIKPDVAALDMLDAGKALKHFEILSRYVDPKGKKVLDLGSGYGTNLIVWSTQFGVDMTGVEPEGEGFASTVEVSRELCRINGVDPGRILAYTGESLPFPDESFDVVYSANVLEHTQQPEVVLDEAFRVLRSGGTLHFEIPNYLAPFEGHYMVLQPPIVWKGLLPFWIRTVIGRDPSFARTLRTEINPVWVRRTIRRLGAKYRLQWVSLGEEIFRERLRGSFRFETRAVRSKLSFLMRALGALNVKDAIAQVLVLLQAHYPMYLTVVKQGPAAPAAAPARSAF
jgi:ubiquinone/menaquinone biosynthesis C-methylase UbiE